MVQANRDLQSGKHERKMKNPQLLHQPYANSIAAILHRFEDGKPLNSEQLNFLLRNEKILINHDLDLVFKYYLKQHTQTPTHDLPLTLPHIKLDLQNTHQIKDAVNTLLKEKLTHVDLHMTVDQYLQFKAVGIHELIYWHGPQFLSRTSPFPTATPQVVYIQWGKLFGVVKMNTLDNSYILDGNVLVYFEDMQLRSLNQCVLDYMQHHKLELKPEPQHALTLEETPLAIHHPPSPKPSFSIIGNNDQKTDQS